MTRTTTSTYSVSYLIQHPVTKPIMLKHLKKHLPASVKVEDLSYVHGTLTDMLKYNMGGGLPYKTITELIAELDGINLKKYVN